MRVCTRLRTRVKRLSLECGQRLRREQVGLHLGVDVEMSLARSEVRWTLVILPPSTETASIEAPVRRDGHAPPRRNRPACGDLNHTRSDSGSETRARIRRNTY